ncbi:uncharacterized protein PRCAT00002755001 [Priceomyces carsonii]|uniref:uncharacterized protein n=1 Tax=Priceomyces carsonii TaxID=28549 RepID=UPI002ED9E512|nr:unnamed protein product [Priceomyces carsonii]
MSVKAFLVNIKHHLEANVTKIPLRFATGNQSADMDSVISAISYSYFSYIKNSNAILIPLINIPRDDFKLRRDIKLLLERHSITEDLLYFVEDFESYSKVASSIELVLVDHCNIQGSALNNAFKDGKVKVVGIIDHHEDENAFLDANPRIIHSNGSCSALVFNYWYSQFDDKTVLKQNEIIELLLGPLLIDTSNMTQKVEEGDEDAIKTYKQLLNPDTITTFSSSQEKTDSDPFSGFYSELKKAKKDLHGFSLYDILRKDYKQFTFGSNDTVVGFSSVGKSYFWLFKEYSPEHFKKALNQMLQTLKLDLLVVTTSYTTSSGKYTREFSYYYDLKNAKFDKLYKLADPKLKLNLDIYKGTKFADKLNEVNSSGHKLEIFNQVNIKASRKQVVPVIKDVLEEHD